MGTTGQQLTIPVIMHPSSSILGHFLAYTRAGFKRALKVRAAGLPAGAG